MTEGKASGTSGAVSEKLSSSVGLAIEKMTNLLKQITAETKYQKIET